VGIDRRATKPLATADLFVPQGYQRVHPHRAPCGDQRSGEPGDEKRDGNARQGNRIGSFDLEELPREQTARQHSGAQPQCQARCQQPARVPKTRRSTCARPAPSAMRMPISCVACVTEYEMTP
jgi:hypothetical protein